MVEVTPEGATDGAGVSRCLLRPTVRRLGRGSTFCVPTGRATAEGPGEPTGTPEVAVCDWRTSLDPPWPPWLTLLPPLTEFSVSVNDDSPSGGALALRLVPARLAAAQSLMLSAKPAGADRGNNASPASPCSSAWACPQPTAPRWPRLIWQSSTAALAASVKTPSSVIAIPTPVIVSEMRPSVWRFATKRICSSWKYGDCTYSQVARPDDASEVRA